MKRVIREHNEIRKLTEVVHYPSHEEREDSYEFRKIKKQLKAQGVKCFIDNGYCEGKLELHHIIEYSTANAVDWSKVERDLGFNHVDDLKNIMPLCAKHHRWVGTGIHQISYPAWILQKYLLPEDLAEFEAAVKKMLEQEQDHHQVNHLAKKMILHLSNK